MTNLDPSQIRAEISPITLQEPPIAAVIQQARAKGMTVGGNFPLASGTNYVVMFFDVADGVEQEELVTNMEAVADVNNAYYVGAHTTGINLPGKQWEVNLRIKIRETNSTVVEIEEEPVEEPPVE